MRTPLSWPSTRNENTPFRFLNRLTANIGWTFMLRLPRQLGNLASGFHSSEEKSGGEGGIRTLGTLAGSHDFQSCTFDPSATSPVPDYRAVRRAKAKIKGQGVKQGQTQSTPSLPNGK